MRAGRSRSEQQNKSGPLERHEQRAAEGARVVERKVHMHMDMHIDMHMHMDMDMDMDMDMAARQEGAGGRGAWRGHESASGRARLGACHR